MQREDTIWTKGFISLFFANLFIFIVFYGLVAALPLYALGVLGKTEQQAGLLMSVFMISAIIVRPFTGKILDTVGKRRSLWLSLIFFLICTLFYYLTPSFGWLLCLRFFHGIWFGVLTTACASIAADIIPARRRGTGLGYFTMSMNLGVVLGPLVSLSVIQAYSFHTLFIILSLFMIIGAIISILVPAYEECSLPSKVKKKLSIHDLFEKKALPVASLALLIGISYSSVLSYLSIYAQERGLLHLTSVFFLVYTSVMLLTRPFTGRLFDSKGPLYVVYPGLISFIIGLVLLAYTNSPTTFLIAGGFVGLGYGSIVPSMQTMAIQSVKIERSGYATATFFTLFDTGIAIGSFLFGIIAVAKGYSPIYIISAVVVGCVIVLTALKSQSKQVKETADIVSEAGPF
ncbi:MFS transporter [Ammoniphilus oxalaticus]|uniref:MFS transporter n=1 Tax=Ammoniphilus oxalaticus TaxID=66863 RepID=A0A419SFW0_9BACL|nr:MFS transporter [Ammoniphilus oxalaticus]RKD22667.1 MFS transporter [Ammoniphilus oxalaticus]